MNPENAIGYRDLGLIATYLAALGGSDNELELSKAKAYFEQCLLVNKEDPVCIDGLKSALNDHADAVRQLSLKADGKIRNAQSGQ